MPLPRNKFLKVGIVILATPVAIVGVGIWVVIIVVVAVRAWEIIGDTLRFASLQPYKSELSLLPVPATSDGSFQQSHSSDLGQSYGLYIERDYTFKTPVSPQAVYDYYYWQLGPRGWIPDPPQTNTPNSSNNRFTWVRAGSHGDTLSYVVDYVIGAPTSQPEAPYTNVLELTNRVRTQQYAREHTHLYAHGERQQLQVEFSLTSV